MQPLLCKRIWMNSGTFFFFFFPGISLGKKKKKRLLFIYNCPYVWIYVCLEAPTILIFRHGVFSFKDKSERKHVGEKNPQRTEFWKVNSECWGCSVQNHRIYLTVSDIILLYSWRMLTLKNMKMPSSSLPLILTLDDCSTILILALTVLLTPLVIWSINRSSLEHNKKYIFIFLPGVYVPEFSMCFPAIVIQWLCFT